MNHWQFIHTKISQKKAVYLLAVIQHKGSSPGRQGFKMVVSEDEIYGSIGGGVMEFNLVEYCKELIQQQQCVAFIKHQIHKGTITDGSGMICSGEQTIIFYPLNHNDVALVTHIQNTIAEGRSGVLTINPNLITFSTQGSISSAYVYTHESETDWNYQEHLNKKDTIYIIGSGHVGLATTKLFREMGFYTVVFDNRRKLNTFEANIYANEKKIISYDTIAKHFSNDNAAYVVIMTNKYTDDKLVLRKLLHKHFKFIGVLGSSAKLEVLFDVLKKEGFKDNQLQQVNAPIGLKIHSQTPIEIAISIAGQIIAIKNKKEY